jgi:hypothetical protein
VYEGDADAPDDRLGATRGFQSHGDKRPWRGNVKQVSHPIGYKATDTGPGELRHRPKQLLKPVTPSTKRDIDLGSSARRPIGRC